MKSERLLHGPFDPYNKWGAQINGSMLEQLFHGALPLQQSSRFSSNSEAFASELQENLEEMCVVRRVYISDDRTTFLIMLVQCSPDVNQLLSSLVVNIITLSIRTPDHFDTGNTAGCGQSLTTKNKISLHIQQYRGNMYSWFSRKFQNSKLCLFLCEDTEKELP